MNIRGKKALVRFDLAGQPAKAMHFPINHAICASPPKQS